MKTVIRRIIRLAIGLALLTACFYLVRISARAGLSRLYSTSVIKGATLPGTEPEQLLTAANESSRLAPLDPDAYRARGVAELSVERPVEAAIDYAHSATLRPRHYLLWMDLGRARDQADDIPGAIEAFRKAVQLAPYFAQPRWQLANVLFRAERYDEAFPELRRAIAGDPTLLPLSMELAWAGSNGDAEKFTQMIDPANASQRLIVGRFLAKHGKAREAVELFHATGGIAEEDQKELVRELMAAKQFASAYEVWASGRTDLTTDANGLATITDGGFESKITLGDPGFGWQVNSEVPTFKVALETTIIKEGLRSLRLEWSGESNPSSQLVTQVALVMPNTSYRLTYSAMAKGLISGGLPFIVISDESSREYNILGESGVVVETERDWKEYYVDFKTSEDTGAILISLQRRPCESSPCPIFGRVWLDSFSLRKT